MLEFIFLIALGTYVHSK